MGRSYPDVSKKVWQKVCKYIGIWDGIVNPIYGCGVEITPDINPIYVGIERSFPDDSKNGSFVEIGLV